MDIPDIFEYNIYCRKRAPRGLKGVINHKEKIKKPFEKKYSIWLRTDRKKFRKLSKIDQIIFDNQIEL